MIEETLIRSVKLNKIKSYMYIEGKVGRLKLISLALGVRASWFYKTCVNKDKLLIRNSTSISLF